MNFRKIAVSTIAAAAVMTGAAGIAAAAIDNVGGGTWDHGADAKSVWSYYDHGSNCHSSSTRGENGLKQSGPTRAGQRSYASDSAALWGNQAYWNNEATGCR